MLTYFVNVAKIRKTLRLNCPSFLLHKIFPICWANILLCSVRGLFINSCILVTGNTPWAQWGLLSDVDLPVYPTSWCALTAILQNPRLITVSYYITIKRKGTRSNCFILHTNERCFNQVCRFRFRAVFWINACPRFCEKPCAEINNLKHNFRCLVENANACSVLMLILSNALKKTLLLF